MTIIFRLGAVVALCASLAGCSGGTGSATADDPAGPAVVVKEVRDVQIGTGADGVLILVDAWDDRGALYDFRLVPADMDADTGLDAGTKGDLTLRVEASAYDADTTDPRLFRVARHLSWKELDGVSSIEVVCETARLRFEVPERAPPISAPSPDQLG